MLLGCCTHSYYDFLLNVPFEMLASWYCCNCFIADVVVTRTGDCRCYRRVITAGVVVTGAKLSARVVVTGETLIATVHVAPDRKKKEEDRCHFTLHYQFISCYQLLSFYSLLFFPLSLISLLTFCPQGIFYVWILGLATALIIHLLEHWHHFYTNKI